MLGVCGREGGRVYVGLAQWGKGKIGLLWGFSLA